MYNLLSQCLGILWRYIYEIQEKYQYNRKIIGEAVLELYKEKLKGKRRDRLVIDTKLLFDFDKIYSYTF